MTLIVPITNGVFAGLARRKKFGRSLEIATKDTWRHDIKKEALPGLGHDPTWNCKS